MKGIGWLLVWKYCKRQKDRTTLEANTSGCFIQWILATGHHILLGLLILQCERESSTEFMKILNSFLIGTFLSMTSQEIQVPVLANLDGHKTRDRQGLSSLYH